MNQRSTARQSIILCLMGALAMSYGWGFRGDYGHESGAMIPGALLAMGVCLCSGRADWFRRCAVMGLCGAIGWAFGGQQSYGQIPSYTVSHSFPDVAYGYACLFIVGALWGGIGGAILTFALTKPRSELNRYVGPLLAVGALWFLSWLVLWLLPDVLARYEEFSIRYLRDTDWLAALLAALAVSAYRLFVPRDRHACNLILLMVAGWWIGYLVLVHTFGLHMSPTPPPKVRSDNWGGCVGLFVVLVGYLLVQRNRAGVMLACYGFLAGGVGFSMGDFFNKPDKVRWEPFYQYEFLRGFDHWKWSEQGFGLVMGLGLSFALLRLLRGNLAPPDEDAPAGPLNDLAAFLMVVVMMWWTLGKNVFNWMKPERLVISEEPILGVGAGYWCLGMALLLSGVALHAIYKHRKGRLGLAPATAFGKGQVLFLLVLWISLIGVWTQAFLGLTHKGIFFVHASFWLTAIACTWIAVHESDEPKVWSNAEPAAPSDLRWNLGWSHWLLWALIPAYIAGLSFVTMAMHDEPMDGSRLRFSDPRQIWRGGEWVEE